MALATLSIDLNARLAGLQEGMDKAVRIAEKSTARIEAKFSGLKNVAVGIGAALGASLSVGALTQLFRATVDGIDALNDFADATGASIESLSGLEDVALRSGTSMQTAGDAVIKLNKALGDAKPGSPLEGVFKTLGLSVKELKALDPAEALLELSKALSVFANDGNKARFVQEIFGKSLREVAPLLNDLAEAGKLNSSVTTEQAKEAELFNRQLAAISKNSLDAARNISGPLIEALNKLFDKIPKEDQFLKLKFDASVATTQLSAVTSEMEKLQAYIDKQQNPSPALAMRMKQLSKEAETLTAQSLAAAKALKEFAGPTGRPANEGGGGLRSRSMGGLPDVPDQTKQSDADRYLDSLRKQMQGVQELTAAEKVLAEIRGGELKDATPKQKERALAIAREIDATKEAIKVSEARVAMRKKDEEAANDAAAANSAADRARLSGLLANTQTAALQEVLKDVELLNSAYERGVVGVEQWAEAIIASTEKLRKDTEEKAEEISEFAKEASRNIQDALGDSVLQVMDGKFSNIGKLWLNMLKQMASQAIAANLAEKLLGKGYGGTTNKVGGWAQLIGNFFGGGGGSGGGMESFPGGSFGGAFANGGFLGAGKWGIAGEAGPEIIKGPAQVVPMAGGSTFQVIVQGDASENTIALINGAIAQYEARQMGRV